MASVAAVIGLGHVGIYVRDLEKMVAFYRDTLGMRITKQNWRAGIVFFSSDTERADLRNFHRRLLAAGLRIDALVNHVSALGCYYFDPEGNRSEVFWVTGRACWVPIAHLIDIHQSDAAVLGEVDALWERLRHVQMGERMANEPATLRLD
jgi:catechol 2,3-dioxygenase-like lactoylglutathione lyase family enzyme